MKWPAVVIAVFLAGHASAQLRCLPTDTPRQCFLRFVTLPGEQPEAPLQKVEQTADTVRALIAGVNAGVPPSTGTLVRSALKDFLNVLSTNVDASSLQEEGEALTFAYNLPVSLLGAERQLQYEAVFRTPEPTIQTTEELTVVDDWQSRVTFNPLTLRFGRHPAPHRHRIAKLLFGGEENGQETLARALIAAGIAASSADTAFDRIISDPATAATMIAAFETAAREAVPADTTLAEAFAKMIGNQPELYFTASYHHRNLNIGPPEWAGQLTWTIGARSLNLFYRTEGLGCDEATLREADATRCAEALRQFAARTNSADRLLLAVRYGRSEETKLPPPHEGTFAAERRLIYMAAFGRPFASFVPGAEGRLDFSIAYDGTDTQIEVKPIDVEPKVREDGTRPILFLPAPRERLQAAITYTQKISDRISVPFSVVYTDRTVFVPGQFSRVSPVIFTPPSAINRRGVSFRAGVTYKVTPPSPLKRPCCCR